MDNVSIREARKNLSEIVKAAERGKSTVITKHGKKVAQIDPVGKRSGRKLPDLTDFRKAVRVKGSSLTQTVLEQRKGERY